LIDATATLSADEPLTVGEVVNVVRPQSNPKTQTSFSSTK